MFKAVCSLYIVFLKFIEINENTDGPTTACCPSCPAPESGASGDASEKTRQDSAILGEAEEEPVKHELSIRLPFYRGPCGHDFR